MQYDDWGARTPRWAGIRSETVEVGGTSAHLLRADAGKAAPSARFVRALTSALRLHRVVAYGWSMGGLVALLFAADAPARVTNLVLAGAPLPAQ